MHAKKAFWKRYHIKYSRDVREEMIATIKKGECEILEKQSNRLRKVKFKYRGKEVLVVWDRFRQNIVTALLEDWKPPKRITAYSGKTYYGS
jgi:hypothetical protein